MWEYESLAPKGSMEEKISGNSRSIEEEGVGNDKKTLDKSIERTMNHSMEEINCMKKHSKKWYLSLSPSVCIFTP